MFRQVLAVCLLLVAVSQASSLYKGPVMPLKLQLDAKFRKHVTERIIGGDEVTPYSIPFQVSFQTTGGFHFCGGSVYDENTIITAAHCCDGQSTSQIKIVAGEHSLATNEGFEQERKVKMIVVHEDYDSLTLTSDICLLKLDSPLELKTGEGAVGKVAMPDAAAKFPAGTPAEVSGWGASDVLMLVAVVIVSDEACNSGYGGSYFSGDHICASDSCPDSFPGDSGGPLTCGADRVLCGIVSWGYGCAEPGYPGVYSRTTTYVDWVKANAQV